MDLILEPNVGLPTTISVKYLATDHDLAILAPKTTPQDLSEPRWRPFTFAYRIVLPRYLSGNFRLFTFAYLVFYQGI